MRKFFTLFIMASLAALVLAACGDDNSDAGATDADDDKLQVVASFTIISDIVRQIGGDLVDVHNLVPTGTDPHEYEPVSGDSKKAAEADIFFYNGMNLEGGDDGWFARLLESSEQDEDKAYSLTERVEPMYLEDETVNEHEVNPHTFIDPTVGILMAEDMRDAFVEVDPDNADAYEENAEEYIERLQAIDEDYAQRIGDLPEDNKTLVTSECAYQYMLDTYGMDGGCIWKVDTEENGSREQITGLVEFIEEKNVETVFMESNVEPRPMEQVSEESGVEIFDKHIYSDEIGEPGSEIDTYVKYLNYNIDIISEGLGN